jgi:predicted DCC family thiol-disulfide oxidoreductase YuxK
MAADSEANQGKMTVYYDGECPICSIEIGHYRRCRGSDAVEFVDIADAAIVPPHDLARDVALARFHVRSPDGLLVSGAAGFVMLWRHLPGRRWLGLIASNRVILRLLEWGYLRFLPIRSRMSHFVRRVQERRAG